MRSLHPRASRELTSHAAVYNTPYGAGQHFVGTRSGLTPEEGAVIRCPECAAEIDVDEDEVEEGEILNCPECEVELEVVQTHPVHLNLISDDDDEEEEEEGEFGANGDLTEKDKKDEEDEEEDEE